MSRNRFDTENVHLIRPEQGNPLSPPPSVETGYGLKGQEVDVRSAECLAKKVEGQYSTSYFIKRASAGPDAGRLYNPHSPNHMPGQNPLKVLGENGRARYEFRKVSREAFENYLAYLRTNNPSFIRMAERDI